MSAVFRLSVVLLAEPGYIRDGMVSILFSISMIGEVRVSSLASYLGNLEGDKSPDLFLIDCTTGQPPLENVKILKASNPTGLIVTLIKDADRYSAAQQSGASAVLLEGFSGIDLIKLIRELFAQKPGLQIARELSPS